MEPRAWDVLGEVARLVHPEQRVATPVQHQCRHPDGGQRVAHVDAGVRRMSARTVPGVAAARMRCAHQRCLAASADGQRRLQSASQSQLASSFSAYAASSSMLCAHGLSSARVRLA